MARIPNIAAEALKFREASAAASRGRRPAIGFRMVGDKQIADVLASIPQEMREKFVPAALRFAGAAIVRRARALVPVDRTATPSGLLKKAIGLVMRGRRGRPKYIAFGARKGFGQSVTRPITPHGEIQGASTRKSDPFFYAHLVEFGHFVVTPKRGTSIRKGNAVLASGKSFVPARPFLRPAMMGSKNEVKARIVHSIRQQLQKFCAKAAKGTFFGRAA